MHAHIYKIYICFNLAIFCADAEPSQILYTINFIYTNMYNFIAILCGN